MAPLRDLKVGDKVEYHPIGGASDNTSKTTGTIEDILTSPEPAGDTQVIPKASEEEPRFVIRNDNTGKTTAYKAMNIIRKV